MEFKLNCKGLKIFSGFIFQGLLTRTLTSLLFLKVVKSFSALKCFLYKQVKIRALRYQHWKDFLRFFVSSSCLANALSLLYIVGAKPHKIMGGSLNTFLSKNFLLKKKSLANSAILTSLEIQPFTSSKQSQMTSFPSLI